MYVAKSLQQPSLKTTKFNKLLETNRSSKQLGNNMDFTETLHTIYFV